MAAVALFAAALIKWKWGWHIAIGFAAGCCVAGLNWFWLKSTVEKATEPESLAVGKRPTSRVVGLFVLRYVLIGVGAYVIFGSSSTSFYAFFAGLLLPVAAIVCEAVYEVYGALRGTSV